MKSVRKEAESMVLKAARKLNVADALMADRLEKVEENARKLIQENYDWSVLRSQFLELVEDRDG